jgi:hypothetical protein
MATSEERGKHRDRESHYRRAAFLHPLRGKILRRMSGGEEAGTSEIAAELDEAPGRIAHHLRILVRRRALKVVPRCRPAPPLYRWSPDAEWARKMLDELDELGPEDL